jgi:hypothetical protein
MDKRYDTFRYDMLDGLVSEQLTVGFDWGDVSNMDVS